MKLLILNRKQVRNLLSIRSCMDMLSQAFQAYSSAKSIQPLRTMMKVSKTDNILASMPGYDGASGALAVKLITIFHNAVNAGLDSHQGLVVLFSAKHGNPLAIMDASEITAIRTAAASGVATEVLANKKAASLAILGAGVQARSHFFSMNEARSIQSVKIWNRSLEGAKKLAKELIAETSLEVTVSNTAQMAITDADLICTVTASAKPILKGSWLKPGVHINAVGSSSPTKRELDTEAVIKSKIFVDSRESALNEAGDLLIPKSEGALDDHHILGEIGQVLRKETVGRNDPEDITLFKSLGMAVEDVAAAQYIYNQAQENDIGVWIDI